MKSSAETLKREKEINQLEKEAQVEKEKCKDIERKG